MIDPLAPITKETPWFDSRTGKYVADAILPNQQFEVSLLDGNVHTVQAQKWEVIPSGELRFYAHGWLVCVVAAGQWRYVEKVGDGSNL